MQCSAVQCSAVQCSQCSVTDIAASLENFLTKLSDTFEKMRRIEGRVANDQVMDCNSDS